MGVYHPITVACTWIIGYARLVAQWPVYYHMKPVKGVIHLWWAYAVSITVTGNTEIGYPRLVSQLAFRSRG